MVKDVGIAIARARPRIDAPYLREALKLWRDAERHLPAGRRPHRAYEYLKRRSAPRAESLLHLAARAHALEPASIATSLHLSGWPAATGAAACSRARGRAAGSPARANPPRSIGRPRL